MQGKHHCGFYAITKKTIITYKQLTSRNQGALNQFRVRAHSKEICRE